MDRLVKGGVIDVQGAGPTTTRRYRFTMRPSTHSTMHPTAHSGDTQIAHSKGAKSRIASAQIAHSTMRPGAHTRKEEKKLLRSSEEEDGAGKPDNRVQLPYQDQVTLSYLLAEQEKLSIEGKQLEPHMEEQLKELLRSRSLPNLRTRA